LSERKKDRGSVKETKIEQEDDKTFMSVMRIERENQRASWTCYTVQCVAVCCSVLQCVAVCCSVLQCVASCCSVLHRVASCCSVLQCVAVCCNVLQCVAVCCSVLQCVASCCSVLQTSKRHHFRLYVCMHLRVYSLAAGAAMS